VEQVREKVSVRKAWEEIKALGKRHGTRFLIAAAIWEFGLEDGLFPLIAVWYHHPEIAVLLLFLHFEPVVYPIILWGFRMYDRFRGRVSWEPERSAMSSYSRTALKVLLYRLYSATLFWLYLSKLHLNLWLLTVYMGLMLLFHYAHERMWHDWNWGITTEDQVLVRRTLLKTLSYRLVSFAVMAMVCKGALGWVPWEMLLLYQLGTSMWHLALECFWSVSTWGIQKTHYQEGNHAAASSCN
jgi:hypothetical protein